MALPSVPLLWFYGLSRIYYPVLICHSLPVTAGDEPPETDKLLCREASASDPHLFLLPPSWGFHGYRGESGGLGEMAAPRTRDLVKDRDSGVQQ